MSCGVPCVEIRPRAKFSLGEILDALNEAFQASGGMTARDCRVEAHLRENLSARRTFGKCLTPICEEEPG